MGKRIQSPSSINIYRQCPRKYFYQYILKLPTKPSIHLVRGSIVHEVLERFFDIDIIALDEEEYEFGLRSYISANFVKLWKKKKNRLNRLGLSSRELEHYFVESHSMINNFLIDFCSKIKKKKYELGRLKDAFEFLKPKVEEEIKNTDLRVRGFIDAIHETEEGISIIDYKTSKKDEITDDYRLQLGIYALLYKLKYDVAPCKVGINFLKYGERLMDVDDNLLKDAKEAIEQVHENTVSEDISDYEKKESGLCKWRTGQCDFYEQCCRDK